jgi:hypothetical protein
MRSVLKHTLILASSVAVISLVLSSSAFAHVGSGGVCVNCHAAVTGRISVLGNLTTPTTTSVATRLDGGTTSALKCFNAAPGGSVSMTLNVTNGGLSGDLFAIALTGTVKGGTLESLSSTTIKGVKTSATDILGFAADPTWTAKTSGGLTYYTQGPLTWSGSATSKTFTFTVAPGTPKDVYSLTLKATGVDSNVGMWTQSEEFLLNVTPEPATLALLGLGGIVTLVRKRMRKA